MSTNDLYQQLQEIKRDVELGQAFYEGQLRSAKRMHTVLRGTMFASAASILLGGVRKSHPIAYTLLFTSSVCLFGVNPENTEQNLRKKLEGVKKALLQIEELELDTTPNSDQLKALNKVCDAIADDIADG